MLAGLLNQFVTFSCCMSLNLLITSLAVLIRQSPAILDQVRRSLRFLFILSYRIYAAVLSRLAPLIYRLTHINLLTRWPRLLASLSLSLLLGTGFYLLLGLAIGLGSIGLCAVHGLLVGGLWDELTEPGSIRLGERL